MALEPLAALIVLLSAPVVAAPLEAFARLAPDGRAVAAVLSGTWENPAPWAAPVLRLWLYPRVLGEPPGDADAQKLAWEYPAGFEPARLDLVRVRLGPVGGPLRDAVPAADPREPHALLLPLPAPLLPGASVEVRIEFELIIPQRSGLVGAWGDVVVLGAGWTPRIAPAPPEGWPDPEGFSRAKTTVRARVAAPRGWSVAAPGTGEALWAARGKVACLDGARGDRVCWRAAPRPTRGPRAGERLGWTRTAGIAPAAERTAVERARRALDALAAAAARWSAAAGRAPPPTSAYVAPLKTEVALPVEGAVILSDRAFALPPAELAMRYHAHEVERAALAAWAQSHLRAGGCGPEAPATAAWAPDAVAEALLAGEAPARVDRTLALLDFLPGIDAFLRAPSGPLAHVYLRRIEARDAARRDPWSWPFAGPPGRLVATKLQARFGEAAVGRAFAAWLACRWAAEGEAPATRAGPLAGAEADIGATPATGSPAAAGDATDRVGVAPPPTSLAAHLAALGPEASALVAAWSGPPPRLRYALAHVDGASVVIERSGQAVPDPVTLRLRWADQGTDLQLLVTGPRTAVALASLGAPPEPPALVELDPERRLIEEVPPGEDPRAAHRVPPGWQVVVQSFLPAYLASQGAFQLYAESIVLPRGDRKNRLLAAADFRPTSIEASLGYARSFGPAAHAGRLAGTVGVWAGGARLLPGPFAQGARAGWLTLSLTWDDTPNTPLPTFSRAASLALRGAAAFPDGGGARLYGSAGLRAVASLPAGPLAALFLRARAGAAFGPAPVQDWPQIGGLTAARGFEEGEVPARQRWLLGGELRGTLVDDLGLDLLSLAWLRGVQGGLFADLAGARGIAGLEHVGYRLFGDVGMGARLLFEYFGAQQGYVSVEAGVPFGRLARDRGRSPVAVYVRLLTPGAGL